jgi:pimeloyl-ACP methyl ester carboxylesterase
VTGTLTLLHREKRTHCQRVRRALWAWFWNRGLRDTWQWLEQRLREAGVAGFLSGSKGSDPSDDPTANRLCRDVKQRWNDVLALASRAGEVRLLEYGLTIGRPQLRTGGTTLDTSAYEKGCIRGLKRLTYGRRSNPWRQLSQMIVITFPGLRPAARWMWLRQVFRLSRPKWPPVLELDTKFLAQVGAPLLRIVGQQDQPSALADLASFLAYFLRLLLNIHIWSFRSPDPPIPREPQRLPEIVEDLPAPQIKELEVDRLPIGTPVYVRLTRYRTCRASGRPVVMIHGYSASGTTYAHHAVRPNLAQHFCDRKRDVWILDLRTSSGMPAARCPWTFEDAALVDLPAAFDYIRRETRQTLDVFAHCMGAAMFSMAVLKPPEPGEKFFRERQELPRWIRRAVLSQIGPVVVMSPANTFRAYAFSYLRQFLPLAGYDFRVKPDPGLMDQLIDRFLATLPYPEEEFDIENPPYRFWRRTPFVGTRHRMDALYGRDFSLANKDGIATLDDKVLEYIDDLFGPLSIDTVSQGIHFTRLQEIANQAGRNDYVLPKNIKERWTFPTLSIHGEDNGLADVATLARMKDKVAPYANAEIMTCSIPGFGHQDCLIGKNAGRVFEKISQYLSEVLS